MTDKLPATAPPKLPAAIPEHERPSKPHRVTGRLRIALDAMVFEALEMDQAAERANMTTRNLRLAMQKSWVQMHMRQQRAVLIAELSASNAHHIRSLRANSANGMVKLGATRLVEELGGGIRQGVTVDVTVRAGFVLDLREDDDEKGLVTIAGQQP